MNTNNTPTRATATPEQLANGNYEVHGVMGGQGRRPEAVITSMVACCVGFAAMVLLLCCAGFAALLRAIF